MISIAIHRHDSPVIERIAEVPSLTCPLDEASRAALGLPRHYADGQCGPGESWIEVPAEVDGKTHYIDVEQRRAVEREPFEPQLSVDHQAVSIIGLPAGTVISVLGHEVIADGDDEIAFDVPGTYRIDLSHPHYLDDSLEVTVG